MSIKALLFFIIMLNVFLSRSYTQKTYHEQYRPQIHFSPKEHWTNDPIFKKILQQNMFNKY